MWPVTLSCHLFNRSIHKVSFLQACKLQSVSLFISFQYLFHVDKSVILYKLILSQKIMYIYIYTQTHTHTHTHTHTQENVFSSILPAVIYSWSLFISFQYLFHVDKSVILYKLILSQKTYIYTHKRMYSAAFCLQLSTPGRYSSVFSIYFMLISR